MIRPLIYIISFLYVFNSFSQTETFQFQHFSSEEGVSQVSVIAIEQDDLGQIWLGTRNGLNKFDGNKVTVYKNIVDNDNSLSDNDILSIKQDRDGFIWIGTHDGLNKFDPKTETFIRYSNEENNDFFGNAIWDIEEVSNGEIWSGTSNGLLVYNNNLQSFNSLQDGNSFYWVSEKNILSIIELENGLIFLGTRSGLLQLISREENNLKFKEVVGSEDLIIQDLIESTNNTLLLGTKTKGILEFNPLTGYLSSYLPDALGKKNNQNVRSLVYDDNEQLWVGTYNGLQVISKNKDIVNIRSSISNPKGLSHNAIKSLFKDEMGSIWIGTYYGGVNIWNELNNNFINIKQSHDKNGLSNNVVSSIESFKNFIFFGTEGGGITVLNRENNTYKHLDLKNHPQLLDNNIKSMLLSKNNILWIGTLTKGVVFYDVENQVFTDLSIPKEIKNYLTNSAVYSIKQDNSNNIWLGVIGKGLVKYNLDTKKSKIFKVKNDSNSIASSVIRYVFIDSKQVLWVGTENGLNKIDSNQKITKYFYNSITQAGDRILCIYEDSNNCIWVGTRSKGIFKLTDNGFKHIDLLAFDTTEISSIYSIEEDSMSNLWISTSQGLVSYNIHKNNNNKSAIYRLQEGVISNEFNENASHKIGESQFYFGGPAGVTYFDSNKLIKNKYSPDVIITNLIVNNSPAIVNQEKSVLKESIAFTKSIELLHNQGNFTISYVMPNFINSKNNKYKYRLKGLDDNWSYTFNNEASYTIQNSGNYVFEISGSNSDGVSNNEIKRLEIVVKPAPWRSWWAFLIYLSLILVALYYLMKIISSKAKLKNKFDLNLIESDKAKELHNAKLEFFTNVSHEFRTPLALIIGPLKQILEDYTGNKKVYKSLRIIESNANHLIRLINRLMDFRKVDKNFYKVEAAEGNIVKFLKEIYLSFKEFAKEGSYDYTFYTESDDIQVYYDRYKLERVFFNLISNAFRYTPKNGKIIVKVRQENKRVVIEIMDTGVGIPEAYQDKIFDRFFEMSINNQPHKNYNRGTGIGLSIAKSMVEIHGGNIAVKSKQDDIGSVFLVEIPLGRNHFKDDEIIKDFKFSNDIAQYVSQLEEEPALLEYDIKIGTRAIENKTILLVEDNIELREFMRSLLVNNYNIIEASNGKDGVKLAIKEVPDLIVSDIIMPGMVGTELCSYLKKEPKTSHIPIILLTSRSSLIYKLEGLESGADDYLSKPFDINEFRVRIKNLLTSSKVLKEKYSSINNLFPEEINVSSHDEILLTKAINVVEANMKNEQFNIHVFCLELGVSRTKLFRVLKDWSNMTPKGFILHFRMKRATLLLEQGKINISEISQEVGFKNPKHFTKIFKSKFGISPLQYANKFKEG